MGKHDSPWERAAKLPERSARADLGDASVSGESMGGGEACNDAQDDDSSDSSSDVEPHRASAAVGTSLRPSIGITATSKAKGKRVGEERGGRDDGNEPQSVRKRKRNKPVPPEQPALTLLRRVVLFRGLAGKAERLGRPQQFTDETRRGKKPGDYLHWRFRGQAGLFFSR